MHSKSVRSVVAVFMAQAVLTSVAASAQMLSVNRFDLPPQPLGDSIKAVASQTNTNLLFDPKLVVGFSAPAINAEMTTEEAITRLVESAGLKVQALNERTIVVAVADSTDKSSRAAEKKQKHAPSESAEDASKSSSGKSPIGATPSGFWSRFRLAEAESSTDSADSSKLEEAHPEITEIVVSARKREERLQDVPAAVSALTGATLQAMGAQSFADYARSIPGLSFKDLGSGRQVATLRGLNPTTGAAAVGYYIGESPMPVNDFAGAGATNPFLIDLDRVEVLRGPQGTLYGASSIGGTIKLIPHAPNLSQFEGSVKVEALVAEGEDGASPGGESELVLNVPIVEGTAAVRGAFWYRNAGGYINQTFTNAGVAGIATGPVQGTVGNVGDERTWGFRIMALYQPAEQLSVSAMAYVQRQHFDGITEITGGARNPNNQLVQNFITKTAEPIDSKFELYNLTAKYDFSRFNLVSSTSYSDQGGTRTMEGLGALQTYPTFFGDPPSDALLVQNAAEVQQENYNFTQELRLATSQRMAGFDFLVGGFYSKDRRSNGWKPWVVPQWNALVAGNDPSSLLYAPDDNLIFSYTGRGAERQTAEFGELTYHFTDSLSLTGGLRHYDVSNRDYVLQGGWFIGLNVPGVTVASDATSPANGFVYKGNLSYELTPDHHLYAQYAEGYRRGIPQAGELPAICGGGPLPIVHPDSIKSYELGAKTNWLQRRLTVNAAAYRINWSDIQQVVFPPCQVPILQNSGEAVVKGVEFELSGQLTHRVSAGFAGTYLHTELQQDNPVAGTFEGDPIQGVPKWQFAPYVQTTFPVVERSDGFARLDYQYTGSSFAHGTHLSDGSFDPTDEIQVVRLLNLRMGMRHQAWEFALSGTNLFNETARTAVDAAGNVVGVVPGRPRYVITRPRTFSLTATYQF